MQEDQELKHACKLCSKSFPCGRSLGGHMRSHVINSSAAEIAEKKLAKKKLQSVNNSTSNAKTENIYGLREKPKKSFRLPDSNEEDTLLHDKLCKTCGKGFQSWKALFGHMKCHSDKISVSNSVEEYSWTGENQCQSDNETAAPSRRKRSRRTKRYIMATTISDLSIDKVSPSVSEIEQELEEVAMCLIMLSQDVNHWGGLNSLDESSYNNSESLETNLVTRIGGKDSICNADKLVKNKKLINSYLEASNLDSENMKVNKKQSEFRASGVPRIRPKKNRTEVRIVGVCENDKFNNHEVEELEMGTSMMQKTGLDEAELASKKLKASKRKGLELFDSELDCEDSEKKSKFECATCNKSFCSYQALGGHRASHQKIRGSFGSKISSRETSVEPGISPHNDEPIGCEMVVGYTEKAEISHDVKKNKEHECPICFKVFSSGQALGGHKRSHLIAEAKSNRPIVIQKPPTPEIRDFLDLNLPAPVEEDSSGGAVGFKPWWIGNNQKHEALVGVISN